MAPQRHPQTLWTWFRYTRCHLSAIRKHYGHGFAIRDGTSAPSANIMDMVLPYAMAPQRHPQTLWIWFCHTRWHLSAIRKQYGHGFAIRDGTSPPSTNNMDMVSPYVMVPQRHPQTLWTWFRHTQWYLSAIRKHYGHGFAIRDGTTAPSANIMDMVSPYAMAPQRHPQTLWTWFHHTRWHLSVIRKHYGRLNGKY